MNIAVILAGGVGSRMGGKLPKQFLKLDEKTIIEYSIDAFDKNENIDSIAVVMHEDYFTQMETIISQSTWSKVHAIIRGGKERYESSYNAIKFFSHHDNDKIIFHDAVRPMVDDRIINDVVTALDTYNAVMTAIPSTDTIVEVDSDMSVKSIPDRKSMMRVQTPQGFKLSIIKKAYEKALEDENFICTDDCGVVKKYLPEEIIFIVRGEERNIKVTYQRDLEGINNNNN